MSRASSVVTGKPYGVARVYRVWAVARSTVYWRGKPTASELRRRGSYDLFTDAELVGRLRAVLAESPFTGEGYCKVWAMLRDKGVRTSKERTLRLMRENGLLAVKRLGRPHGRRHTAGRSGQGAWTRCGART